MNLVLRIPDELTARLGATGAELERQALEAWVLETFRAGLLNKDELAQALGLEGGDRVDGFLKSYGVFESSSVTGVSEDVATLVRLGY